MICSTSRKKTYTSCSGQGKTAVLAASTQNRYRCTALVCSCYVPSRNSDSKVEEDIIKNVKKRSGVNNDESRYLSIDEIINGCNDGISETIGSHIEPIRFRKSSLKKTTMVTDGEEDRETELSMNIERRKVSWLDSHGKDLAHVREFEPSVSDDGELEGVRRSCVCAIQ